MKLKCLCCQTELESHHEKFNPIENDIWYNGVVGKIGAGYGSEFDEEQFIIAICDECIKSKVMNGLITKDDKSVQR